MAELDRGLSCYGEISGSRLRALGFVGRDRATFGSEGAWLGWREDAPIEEGICASLCPFDIFNPQDSARLGVIIPTLQMEKERL